MAQLYQPQSHALLNDTKGANDANDVYDACAKSAKTISLAHSLDMNSNAA